MSWSTKKSLHTHVSKDRTVKAVVTTTVRLLHWHVSSLQKVLAESSLGPIPSRTCPPGHFPHPDNSPSFLHGALWNIPQPPPPCASLYKAIYRNWKLALTGIPDPNRPTTWGPNPNPKPSPNWPTGRGVIWKLALTRIPYSNRPTTWGSNPNRPNNITHIPDPNRRPFCTR